MDASPTLLPRRKWFQFHLRHVAIVTFLVAVGCWWFVRGPIGIHKTGRDLDVAIFGRGYFVCTHPTLSTTAFTRNGHFQVNSQGQLCVGEVNDGWLLEPIITIPPEFTRIGIASDGTVYYQQPSQTEMSPAGQLCLATFINSEGLQELVPGFFAQTDASGQPQTSVPGESGGGLLQEGYLESPEAYRTDATTLLLAVLCGLVTWLAWEVRCLRMSLRMQSATML